MLARSPTAAAWHSDNDYSSRYIENDVVLATTHRICGTWDGFVEQSVVPHRAKSSRTALCRFRDRQTAQVAVEDFIENHRARHAAFAASDGAALGRAALAAKPKPERDDEFRLTSFDALNHVGTWR